MGTEIKLRKVYATIPEELFQDCRNAGMLRDIDSIVATVLKEKLEKGDAGYGRNRKQY